MTSTASNRPRIALYSHDTMGLGHIRRNTLLAQTLVKAPLSADVLLISGIRESGAFALPAGIDSITLPAYRKLSDGTYRSRSLDIELSRLVALRSNTIEAALHAWDPDLLVIDNVPRGALSELDASLRSLKARGNTRIVLGLRDIIDTPDVVARQWQKLDTFDTLQQFFDAIWVYGDTRVQNTAEVYGLNTLDVPVTHVGYLDPSLRTTAQNATSPMPEGVPYALCMMGGGQDGQAIAEAFAQSTLPAGWQGVILTGSLMPEDTRRRLQDLVSNRADMRIIEFLSEPLELIRQARAVVGMAGYNSTMEVLALDKQVLLVPRVIPREEQWLRANRLSALGLVDCIHPDELTPALISEWLAKPPLPRLHHQDVLDFSGLDRVALQAAELLATPARRTTHVGQ
ncbi:MAG: glycosyltransferase [Lautropia sp.]|nr:glycosyltransferase [Lautropia sp.]